MNICLTGASQGLGAELTRILLAEGHAVWGIARSGETLQKLARSLPNKPFRWSAVDVSSAEDIRNWMTAMQKEHFHPDALILNASVQEDDMVASYDHTRGSQTIAVNLDGALRCVEAFLPIFLKERKGQCIAVTSTVALRPSSRSAAYAASKAGLAMAFRSLRLRYAPEGVRFATVCLGPLRTNMWEGKDRWLVGNTQNAARAMASFLSKKSSTLYYPRISTRLLRATWFLPDATFAFLSSLFLK